MSHPPPAQTSASRRFGVGLFAVAIVLAIALPSYGQMTPEEHAKHHPEQAKEDKAAAPGKAADGKEGGMGGGMDMGKMMGKMGVPPPKDIYPSLMSLPELTPEEREQVRVHADERMRSGVALLSEGLDKLAAATEIEDYAAMQDATAQVREAVALFESGVAAKRALAEAKPPRQVALQWFKGEMNLQPPQGVEARTGLFGVSPFHLFTMALLVAFALAMVALYFVKMRRAAALFGRIEADKASPPPGSAKPLAGSPADDVKAESPTDDAKAAPAASNGKAAPPAADAKTAPAAADAKVTET